jgi:hypothetical protein
MAKIKATEEELAEAMRRWQQDVDDHPHDFNTREQEAALDADTLAELRAQNLRFYLGK